MSSCACIEAVLLIFSAIGHIPRTLADAFNVAVDVAVTIPILAVVLVTFIRVAWPASSPQPLPYGVFHLHSLNDPSNCHALVQRHVAVLSRTDGPLDRESPMPMRVSISV